MDILHRTDESTKARRVMDQYMERKGPFQPFPEERRLLEREVLIKKFQGNIFVKSIKFILSYAYSLVALAIWAFVVMAGILFFAWITGSFSQRRSGQSLNIYQSAIYGE